MTSETSLQANCGTRTPPTQPRQMKERAINSLNSHRDIIILPADKGGATVVLFTKKITCITNHHLRVRRLFTYWIILPSISHLRQPLKCLNIASRSISSLATASTNKRAPMGSPITKLIDETVLQRLGRLVFAVIAPKFRKRYAKDTFVVIKKDQVPSFHQLLNTTLPGIEFALEEPTNQRLPF